MRVALRWVQQAQEGMRGCQVLFVPGKEGQGSNSHTAPALQLPPPILEPAEARLRLWTRVILMCVNDEVSVVSPLAQLGRFLLGTHKRFLGLYKRVMAVNLEHAARNL